jgi:hypothetical protein
MITAEIGCPNEGKRGYIGQLCLFHCLFHCQASHYPLSGLSGDLFAFFLLELRVDIVVDNTVILVLLLISPDVWMPDLPDKPLCFLMLLLCIEFSKRNLFFCQERFRGVWNRKLGPLFFFSLSLTPFQTRDLPAS